jgi:hypothetical protein
MMTQKERLERLENTVDTLCDWVLDWARSKDCGWQDFYDDLRAFREAIKREREESCNAAD